MVERQGSPGQPERNRSSERAPAPERASARAARDAAKGLDADGVRIRLRRSAGAAHRQAAVSDLQRTVGNHRLTTLIRPGLAVDSPTAVREREAERLADAVVRAPEPAGTGQSHDGGMRTLVEGSTGADLGDVRLHTGPPAAAAARRLRARAFAVGRDVVFGAGQYRPGEREGRRLIAHELAHVVQQGGGAPEAGLGRAAAALVQREPEPVAESLDAADRAEAIHAALYGAWWPDAEAALVQLRGQLPTVVLEIRRLFSAISGGQRLEAELRRTADAAQWQEALLWLLPALPLEARLRLNVESHRALGPLGGVLFGSTGADLLTVFTTENERAMISMIEKASVEERLVAVDGADRAAVATLLEASLSWDQLYEARKLLIRGLPDEADRLDDLVRNRIAEAHGYLENDEGAVYDALLDLPPVQRQGFWQRESDSGLFAFLDMQERASVAVLCGDDQQQAVLERMRLATEGVGTDVPGVAAAVTHAELLPPEQRAALVGGKFMEMLHADVAPEEFERTGAALGADPTVLAKQAIIDATGFFGGGGPVVHRVLEELSAGKETREAAQHLLQDREVQRALQLLSVADITATSDFASGDSYRIAARKLRQAMDAVLPDQAAVVRVLLSMSKADRDQLQRRDEDLYKRLVEPERWRDRDLSKIVGTLIAAPEGTAPAWDVVGWALLGDGADREALVAAFGTLDDGERFVLRLGYFLARGGAVDPRVATPDVQEAARGRFQMLERMLDDGLGTDDLLLTLDALLGEPSLPERVVAPELTAGIEQARAADKGAVRADEAFTSWTSRTFMDTFSETGPLTDQAQARLEAVYRQALAEGGVSPEELFEIETLASEYAVAYGEHVAATEQVANLAATTAAVAVGVFVAAASGGTLGPAVAAAMGSGNLAVAALIGGGAVAAARVGTSELIGGTSYDALSREGARDALTGIAEGATNVLAAGLVARFSSFVGVGGATLSERLAAGTIAAGEAALPGGARSVTVAAGRSAVENFLAGATGGVVLTASDEKTWQQSVDDVIGDFARSLLQGGVPAAFGGTFAGAFFEALAARGGIVRAQRLLTGLTEAGLERARLEQLPVRALNALVDVDAALEGGRLDDAARALSALSGQIEADELQQVWTTLGRRHLGADPPPMLAAPEPPAAAAAETPATVTEAPPPLVEPPTPVAETPAQVTETQAPVTEAPTPGAEPPAPGAEPPAPGAEPPAPVAEIPGPVLEQPAATPATAAPATAPPVPGGTLPAGEEVARVIRPSAYLESPAATPARPTPATARPGVTVARPAPGGPPPAGEDFARVFRRAARAVRGHPAVLEAARRIEAEQFASLGPAQLATSQLGGAADIIGSTVAERSRRWMLRPILADLRTAVAAGNARGRVLQERTRSLVAMIQRFGRPMGVGEFLGLGRPGSIQQRFGMPGDAFTEWVGSVVDAGQSRVPFPGRGGRYPDLVAALAGMDERDIARQIRELISQGRAIAGNASNPGNERIVATRLAYLMFGRETARRPVNLAHAAMTMRLIERGDMTFAEAFAQFEPGPAAVASEVPSGGAYPVSRLAGQLDDDVVERETRRREDALAWRWLLSEARNDQAVVVGGTGVPRVLTPELGGPQDLNDYVLRKLLEFYGLNGP